MNAVQRVAEAARLVEARLRGMRFALVVVDETDTMHVLGTIEHTEVARALSQLSEGEGEVTNHGAWWMR